MATGIPPSVWADEGEQAIATAVEVLNRASRRGGGGRQGFGGGPAGAQMRG